MPARRALVVDDSESIRRQVVAALASVPNLACTEAGDGAAGIRAATSAAFDIVVTDLNMPLVGGLGLVTWLRGRAETRAVPIVVLTTVGDEENRRRLLAAGATAYLTKPVDAPQLVAKVAELLAAGQAKAG